MTDVLESIYGILFSWILNHLIELFILVVLIYYAPAIIRFFVKWRKAISEARK